MATKRLTRNEKKARLKAALIDAATDLFAKHGYWGVSIDEIAERAGVTKGAVYSNFSSKEQLLLEVAWQQRIDLDPALLEDPSVRLADIPGRLGAEIARIATSSAQRRIAPRELEISTLALTNDKIRGALCELARRQRSTLATMLTRRAEQEGVELALPAEEIAAILLAVQRGLMQQRFIDPDAIPPAYFADALALAFAGTKPPKRKRPPRGRP